MDMSEMDAMMLIRLFNISGKLNTQDGKDDCMTIYEMRPEMRLDLRAEAESFTWRDEFLQIVDRIDNA